MKLPSSNKARKFAVFYYIPTLIPPGAKCNQQWQIDILGVLVFFFKLLEMIFDNLLSMPVWGNENNMNFGDRQIQVQILTLPLISHVTLNKPINVSEPHH